MEKGLENQKRALNLFSSYYNRQTLIKQVSSCEEFTENTLQSFVILLRSEAKHLGLTFPQHATQFVVEGVSHLVSLDSSRKFLLTIIAKLQELEALNGSDIQAKFNDCPNIVPLDILYQCEKLGVISLVLYFQSCVDHSKKATALLRLLVDAACESKNEEKEVLRYFLDMFVQLGHNDLPAEMKNTVSNKTINAASLILKNISRKVWDFLWENPEKHVYCFEISDMKGFAQIKLPSYQKCYLELLAYLLSYKPDVKSATAITSQSEWTYFKNPKNVLHLITQLLVPLDAQAVVEKIDDILSRYEVNWKTLLLVISVIHVCYPLGTKHLKGLITNLLHRAMDKGRDDLLLAALLLARQTTSENNFATYGLWFSTICTTTTSPKHFAFIVKYLNSIVQYEIMPVLRAHLSNPPHIPSDNSCRAMWTDYTTLIRTRLVDLGPANNQNIAVDPQVTVDDGTEKDVEQAVADYERMHRVPNSVLQAAIFKKTYFLHKFLPILLKPRRTPHPPDSRQNMIEDLKKAGKLPAAVYMEYITACQSIDYKLMDGLTLGEEEMEWQTDPMTNFQNQLQQLSECTDPNARNALVHRLAKVLGDVLRPPKDPFQVIDIQPETVRDEMSKDKLAAKVLEHWINVLISKIRLEDSAPSWNGPVFVQLCSNPRLVRVLYLNVWQFITDGSKDPSNVACYGSIIYLLQRNTNLLLPARLDEKTASFVEILMDQLNLKEADSMRFLIVLFRAVLSEGKSANDWESPVLLQIGQIYSWLVRRIHFADCVVESFHSDAVSSESWNQHTFSKLSLEDWLRLEMNVIPDRDVLHWTQRVQYLHSVLQTDYLTEGETISLVIWDTIVRRTLMEPVNRRSDCCQDLLMLLQSQLLHQDPSNSSSVAQTPWLIRYWMDLHKSNQTQNIDAGLWSLVCALPPYLMCKNTSTQPVIESNMQILATLVEDHWKDSISEGAWLPKYVTRHLSAALDGFRGLEQHFPCLQFSRFVHQESVSATSAAWDSMRKALSVFHPLKKEAKVKWSGVENIDVVASQLIAVAATVWYVDNCNQEWPRFVEDLGTSVSQNAILLKGWKMTSWTEGSVLPWRRILPTRLMDLLPCIILQVLLFWFKSISQSSPTLWTLYLECLILAQGHWIRVTQTYMDQLSPGGTCDPKLEYSAGKLLDLATLGRLTNSVKKIIAESPISALKSLQQSPVYQHMDSDLQATIKSRV